MGRMISGSTVSEAGEENRLEDLMKSINASNREATERREAEFRDREQQEAEERRKMEEEAEAARNLAQYEREQEAKRQRLAEEAEEKRKWREKLERNPFAALLYGKPVDDPETQEQMQEEEKNVGIVTQMILSLLIHLGDLWLAIADWFVIKKQVVAAAILGFLANVLHFKVTVPEVDFEKKWRPKKRKKEKKSMKEENTILEETEEESAAEMEEAGTEENVAEPADVPVLSETPVKQKKEKPAKKEKTVKPAKPKKEVQKKETEKIPERVERRGAKQEKPMDEKKAASVLGKDKNGNPLLPQLMPINDASIAEVKEQILESHEEPDVDALEQAIAQIQRTRDILAIVISNATLDDLFIFTDADSFISMVVNECDYDVDCSYIYVITPTATRYFGTDICHQLITNLFDNIRMVILNSNHIDDRALQAIPGIRIFKHIFI